MINENELIRMLLLLADTQAWLNELAMQTVQSLHPSVARLLRKKDYQLSITALAHIIERHYYKTMRHPGTGKFTLPLPQVIDYIKEAAAIEPQPMKGSNNFKRSLQTALQIGITKSGEPACSITVITDPNGAIITAYPE